MVIKDCEKNPPSLPPRSALFLSLISGFHTQQTFGFCFVSGSPATPEGTETLVKRIGFIRETHCDGFVFPFSLLG